LIGELYKVAVSEMLIGKLLACQGMQIELLEENSLLVFRI